MKSEELPKEIVDLLELGKEKGFLTYDEINEGLPEDMVTPEELDELYQAMANLGVELLDGENKIQTSNDEEDEVQPQEERAPRLATPDSVFSIARASKRTETPFRIDLSPSMLDRTNDPVRMYLKEMGNVPLLTRKKEVDLSKKIERGKTGIFCKCNWDNF